jgi:hypothetical protein
MQIMPKLQTDYSKTSIYKLCCNDPNVNEIYIGHTTNFVQRKHGHKTACCNEKIKGHNQYVYQFIRNHGGWDNWSMIEIENVDCKTKREAEAIEHKWIKHLGASLNLNNPHAMYKEEPQLYKQKWYEENKDEILEKAKEHYEEHKEEKIAYQKQYSQENKEKIAEYNKEYIEKNKEKLSEQKKIYREEHKEEAKQSQKAWREENKEKIKAQKSEVINCDCGNQYTFGNKVRHLQTKSHIKYQNALCGIIEPVPTEEEKQAMEEEKNKKLKEQQQKYRETHAQEIHEWKQKHYKENKEKISQQCKKYYEEHKEEIKEKTKKYVEEKKEKIKDYKENWYEKNKEKILQKQKEMITCECGAEVRKAGLAEHYRSKKHNDYVISKNNVETITN